KVLFSENPGIIIQCTENDKVKKYLNESGVDFIVLGNAVSYRKVRVINFDNEVDFDIDSLRDLWFKTSYLLDRKQSGNKLALQRFSNYKKFELRYDFKDFTGKAADLGIDINRRKPSGIKAAIIREKGVN